MSDDFGGRFPRSGPPRKVKGGIRARSRRGAFARSWWARRWLAVLEALQLGGRLARGRAYARAGQVMDLSIEPGLVTARVQGSREEPYAVAIRVTPLSSDQWRKVAEVLGREVAFVARLLAGEMPADIERAFERAGVSLFPTRISQLATSCSCPDETNPCKHIAAVYYLLGEEFERDPFLIFRLRGMTREELLLLLEEQQPAHPDRTSDTDEGGRRALPDSGRPDAGFWRAGLVPEDVFLRRIDGPRPGGLLLRLGAFPFWRGSEPLTDALLPVYERAAAAALEVLADLTRKS